MPRKKKFSDVKIEEIKEIKEEPKIDIQNISLDDLKLPPPPEKKEEIKQESGSGFTFVNVDEFDKKQQQDNTTKQEQTQTVSQLRRAIATNLTTIEKAIFKVITDEPLPDEEEQMLYESWKMIANEFVTDANSGKMMAVLMVAGAHAGIIAVHWEDIQKGIERKKKKKEQPMNNDPPKSEPAKIIEFEPNAKVGKKLFPKVSG